MNIAIIVPALNEEGSIASVIEDFHRELPQAGIFVIDNASTDGTAKIARETFLRIGCPGGLMSETRRGKANAIRKAFREIEADIFVMVDADSTYPAAQIHELIAPVAEGRADMVVGDRHSLGAYESENKRPFHLFGNRLVNGLINTLFRARLGDIMSGYRAFSRVFVKNYPVMCQGFQLETEMSLHALHKRFAIVEIPVRYQDRPPNSCSKLNTFRDGLRVLLCIANIFRSYKPLTFFGSIGILFFSSGLIFGAPVLLEFYQTHYISHVPLAILATGQMILSMTSLAIGIILNTVITLDNAKYELLLLNSLSGKGHSGDDRS
ncbi:MAG: glycosyltransferase [Planctomycetes bacterium]|nr:glycosyltransferase [Planctomycetota bacterium]